MQENRSVGILLVNLGSPAEASVPAVRRFLAEFLGDPRVVNLPRALWWLILHAFILPFRPQKSVRAYQKIWTSQGSPLVVNTRELTERLKTRLTGAQNLTIDYAMRYGKPSLASRLLAFKEQSIQQIFIVPLYPQYSSTTTASVYDSMVDAFNQWRHLPSFQFIGDYHSDSRYIQAVADSIRASWQDHGQSQVLIMSFHGLPKQLTDWGDPYFYQCHNTAKLIADNLALSENQWRIVFQSRFGKAEWLKPYCVEVLAQLPKQGIESVDIVCPGFAVDCLETLEEIAIENKSVFIEAGGKSYRYIPSLNDSHDHAEVIIEVLAQNGLKI